jgi:hypothetical protein
MNDRPNIDEEPNVSELSNPVQNVTFASNGDEAYGYLALPASGSGPGVIVIQEWWGLTTHIAPSTTNSALDVDSTLRPSPCKGGGSCRRSWHLPRTGVRTTELAMTGLTQAGVR